MNDKVTHSACSRLVQSVRQGTATAHLKCPEGPRIHARRAAMQLLGLQSV